MCKYSKVPLGHPKIYVGDECDEVDLTTSDGLIKCEILPPQTLFFPVLPARLNGKLIFTLCHACASNLNMKECRHTTDQRALTGVWVIEEVREAINNGYLMRKVYEIWEFETACYDPDLKSGGVFAEFINEFLKIKQESSGWPAECTTEEARNEYIEQYEAHEGIRLEHAKIQKNESLRSLSKLILNSFW